MAYDSAVVLIAYTTANNMGASDKVMLALFEAAIVESGFRNLNYGDRDSVGFLQQRAGWGTVAERMNVSHATASFVNKAKAIESKYSSASALAQGVQISGFPGRYAMVRGQAATLLAKTAATHGRIQKDIQDIKNNPLVQITELASLLGNPQTWMRFLYCVAGGFLIIIFLFKVTGDNKLSDTTKTIIKTGIKIAAVAPK